MSKWKVTYDISFEVTREVEIDDSEIAEHRKYLTRGAWIGEGPSDDEVVMSLLRNDDEITANAFRDWRANEPLPDDFELQRCDPEDVEAVE